LFTSLRLLKSAILTKVAKKPHVILTAGTGLSLFAGATLAYIEEMVFQFGIRITVSRSAAIGGLSDKATMDQ
jgi:hypothetical protein